MAKLYQLKSAIDDAVDSLDYAVRLAVELTGYEPETEDRPAVEGWPAMDRLSSLLHGLALAARNATPPEIEAAMKDEHDADADYESPEALGLRP